MASRLLRRIQGRRSRRALPPESLEREATLLVVGSRNDEDHGESPDIDMVFLRDRYSGSGGYRKKDGTPL